MNKKFSVVKTLDTSKIHREIYDYIKDTGEENPYIFMNTATIEELAREHYPTYISYGRPLHGYTAKFEGYNVFVNDDLMFGEVEIR